MQLDRTAQLPLDVVWYVYNEPYLNGIFVDLLRQKGHFSRWRTLSVFFNEGQGLEPMLSPTDAFVNLEYLEVHYHSSYHPILQTIDRTVTFKFRTLNLKRSAIPSSEIEKHYGNVLGHAKKLILPEYGSFVSRMSLTTNVTSLEATVRWGHFFPNVQTYIIRHGYFLSPHPIDLQRLTSLAVTSSLELASGTILLLPSLRSISFSGIEPKKEAVIKAPLLEHLHICKNRDTVDPNHLGRAKYLLELAINHPGFLLSPNSSLNLEASVSFEDLVKLIKRSPEVESVSLSIDDEGYATRVLEAIVGGTETSWENTGKHEGFCPRLRDLRMDLLSEECDPEYWMKQAVERMERRCAEREYLRLFVSARGGSDTATLIGWPESYLEE